VGSVGFWLAFDGGSYDLLDRTAAGVLLWWTLALVVAVPWIPLPRPSRAGLVVGALLLAFVAWTGVSITWAASAERAFIELDRAALYLAIYTVTLVLVNRAHAPAWLDGLAVAIVGTTLLALASRLAPGPFPSPESSRFLSTTLSYPLDYANALAIFAGLGFPLVLRAAVASRHPLLRSAWLLPVPALAAVIALASSRGGAMVAVVGSSGFVLLARRWSVFAAALSAAIASAVAAAIVLRSPELAGAPLSTSTGERAGIALALVATALVLSAGFAVGSRLVAGVRPPRALGWAVAATVLLLALAGTVAADPVDRFESFRSPEVPAPSSGNDFGSASSTGRWQHWAAAVEQWQTAPAIGRGAGSYEAWWAEHGSLPIFVRDAHSLYLETLGELGLVGAVLLVTAFGVALVAGARRALTADGPGMTAAAATAAFLAFALAAAFDWMWEMTAVGAVGMALLGLVTAAPPGPPGGAGGRLLPLRLAAGVAALVFAGAQATLLLGEHELRQSEAAVRQEDAEAAVAHARRARDLLPWAASPRLQLALVAEELGDVESSRRWIRQALARDESDWRLWLVSARIEVRAGEIATARRHLDKAIELNPRSSLFARPAS